MWNDSEYGNDLNISKKHAEFGAHPGDCDDGIRYLRTVPSIQRQLKKLHPDQLRMELKQYGAWDETELQDHDMNVARWLWISCGAIRERARRREQT